ncbi:uncharacterized protein [Euwallacea similis]|uniref:uncharacterized protein n=1 Tax=Euwallacea similis TaxID=1736056 RepID=UPI00344DDA6D
MTSSVFLVSLLLAFSLSQKGVVGDLSCGDKSIQCISTTTYRSCNRFLWFVLYGAQTYTCDSGLICEQETGTENCVEPLATTVSTSTSTTITESTISTAGTTSAPLPASCGTNGIHCYNTTTYRSCHSVLGVILYTGDYVVCGTGTTCSENSKTTNCVSNSAATTISSTTTVSSVTPPEFCNIEGERWPAAKCYQYYRCYLAAWTYYVVLDSCSSGQRYNATSKECFTDPSCSYIA